MTFIYYLIKTFTDSDSEMRTIEKLKLQEKYIYISVYKKIKVVVRWTVKTFQLQCICA